MPTAIRLPVLSALVAGLGLAACASAWAGEVRGVALQAGATGTHAEIQLAGGGSYKTLSLSAPNRLVVDFPDSSAVRGLKLPAAPAWSPRYAPATRCRARSGWCSTWPSR